MFIVGAYGSRPGSPESPTDFRRYIDDVLALPNVDGLEIPYQPVGRLSAWSDDRYLRASDSVGTHVLTLIPGMMKGGEDVPGFGLAAGEESARRKAVSLVRDSYEFVARVNDGSGGKIVGVQLHSGPARAWSSVEAFARSMEQIAGWDWGPTWLAVEHCDADTPAHKPEKGFRTLQEELQAVVDLPIGITINWGRSVIETRDAQGAREQIATATAAGRLSGLIFSGVSPEPTSIGHAWADVHVPIRDWSTTSPLADPASNSLLTAEEVEACVTLAIAAPTLKYLGVKVKAPGGATLSQRVEVVAANAAIVTAAARAQAATAS